MANVLRTVDADAVREEHEIREIVEPIVKDLESLGAVRPGADHYRFTVDGAERWISSVMIRLLVERSRQPNSRFKIVRRKRLSRQAVAQNTGASPPLAGHGGAPV